MNKLDFRFQLGLEGVPHSLHASLPCVLSRLGEGHADASAAQRPAGDASKRQAGRGD